MHQSTISATGRTTVPAAIGHGHVYGAQGTEVNLLPAAAVNFC